MDFIDILLIAFIVFCIYMYFKLKNNPKLQEEYKEKLSNKNNIKVPDTFKNEYIDSMDVSVSLKSEKNKLLYSLLKGNKINAKYNDGFAICNITNDKVVGFIFDQHSALLELQTVFEVKNNNGKFRAAEYDLNVSSFTNEKEFEIKSYHNPRTWERVLIQNINIKAKE